MSTLPLFLLLKASSPHTKVRAYRQGPLVSCGLDQFCLHIQWYQLIVLVCMGSGLCDVLYGVSCVMCCMGVGCVMGVFSALIQALCVQNVHVCMCVHEV